MNNEMLSRAIRNKARELYEAHDELHDEFSLLRVLASIAEGRSVEKAFGAPGDWGYGTEIGQALSAMPSNAKLTCPPIGGSGAAPSLDHDGGNETCS